MTTRLPDDMHLLERGWLSSNSLLLSGDARGAVLVDSGYCTHKAQTLALVQQALVDSASDSASPADQQPTLRLIANTHLHSDHCGGNAHLAAAFDCPVAIPPGHFQAVADWDQAVLSFAATGQQCERFTPDHALRHGDSLEQAGRVWQVLAAPGHDPESVILFEPEAGLLVSADALWEHGFGIVFPEIDGTAAFDEVAATLDLIAALPVRVVVPGHGPAFSDVAAAVSEARARLSYFRLNPIRHARYAAKALITFHLLEVHRQALPALLAWLAAVPIHQQIWQRFFSAQTLADWTLELLDDLMSGGVIGRRDQMVYAQGV
jgi:glyoxylase-like metal-dependent hydrolase (beta-lactamase superfamily II)